MREIGITQIEPLIQLKQGGHPPQPAVALVKNPIGVNTSAPSLLWDPLSLNPPSGAPPRAPNPACMPVLLLAPKQDLQEMLSLQHHTQACIAVQLLPHRLVSVQIHSQAPLQHQAQQSLHLPQLVPKAQRWPHSISLSIPGSSQKLQHPATIADLHIR